MRVVHLSKNDIEGGAARATYRIHRGLLEIGVDSRLYVWRKSSDDPTVFTTAGASVREQAVNFLNLKLDKWPIRSYRKTQDPESYFSLNWLPDLALQSVHTAAADVVQLNWVGDGFVNPASIRRFGRPVVWRLSDVWPFTGGCHYPGSCTAYTQACGRCPRLGSSTDRDPTRKLWERKQRTLSGAPLTVVSPSRWMAGLARDSSLFGGFRVEVIPSGVDEGVFQPLPKAQARKLFGFDPDDRVIAFGAIGGTASPRKGFSYLQDALALLQRGGAARYRVLVFGGATPFEASIGGVPGRFVGKLWDDAAISLAYSAADVFVAPSKEENFPSTVLEALACGTPSVAFAIGGMPDLIRHRENGYLARPFEVDDLAAGIQFVLDAGDGGAALRDAARKTILAGFTLRHQSEAYRGLYENLINGEGQ